VFSNTLDPCSSLSVTDKFHTQTKYQSEKLTSGPYAIIAIRS
jgi:hypothetical protein